MKHILQRAAAALLIFALSTQIGAAVLGDVLLQHTLPLSAESTLTQSTWYDGTHRTRKENVLTYTPSADLLPSVIYGTTLYGKSTMETIEKYPQSWGFSVIAGINGSFFDVANGIPYGLVMPDGAVRTSGNLEAIGLKADGSAVIGVPELQISLQLLFFYSNSFI